LLDIDPDNRAGNHHACESPSEEQNSMQIQFKRSINFENFKFEKKLNFFKSLKTRPTYFLKFSDDHHFLSFARVDLFFFGDCSPG